MMIFLSNIHPLLRLLMVSETFTAYVISCWSMGGRGTRLFGIRLVILFCFRGDVQREREREERRVAEISQNL